MTTHVDSIHLRHVEVSDKQGVLYLHGTLGAGKSKRGARVEMASGDDLRGASGNNICNIRSDELFGTYFATPLSSKKAM